MFLDGCISGQICKMEQIVWEMLAPLACTLQYLQKAGPSSFTVASWPRAGDAFLQTPCIPCINSVVGLVEVQSKLCQFGDKLIQNAIAVNCGNNCPVQCMRVANDTCSTRSLLYCVDNSRSTVSSYKYWQVFIPVNPPLT